MDDLFHGVDAGLVAGTIRKRLRNDCLRAHYFGIKKVDPGARVFMDRRFFDLFVFSRGWVSMLRDARSQNLPCAKSPARRYADGAGSMVDPHVQLRVLKHLDVRY